MQTQNRDSIIEGNVLIFDFLGNVHSIHPENDRWEMNQLKYHTSYDWLMPVVKKIGQTMADMEKVIAVTRLPLHTPIDNAWLAVIEFIKYYNTTKQPTNE